MTQEDLAILNSLITFTAEYMPGGLSYDEQRIARIVGSWVIDGIPVRQVCPHCGSVAPSEDNNMRWVKQHIYNRPHRWWWDMKIKLGHV